MALPSHDQSNDLHILPPLDGLDALRTYLTQPPELPTGDARDVRGVLVAGHPGSGKTLLIHRLMELLQEHHGAENVDGVVSHEVERLQAATFQTPHRILALDDQLPPLSARARTMMPGGLDDALQLLREHAHQQTPPGGSSYVFATTFDLEMLSEQTLNSFALVLKTPLADTYGRGRRHHALSGSEMHAALFHLAIARDRAILHYDRDAMEMCIVKLPHQPARMGRLSAPGAYPLRRV